MRVPTVQYKLKRLSPALQLPPKQSTSSTVASMHNIYNDMFMLHITPNVMFYIYVYIYICVCVSVCVCVCVCVLMLTCNDCLRKLSDVMLYTYVLCVLSLRKLSAVMLYMYVCVLCTNVDME